MSLNNALSADIFVEQLNDAFSKGLSLRFTPSGNSMLPTLNGTSDIVTLSAPRTVHKYDAVLFRRDTGALVLHRVIGISGDDLTVSGDNQYWTEHTNCSDVLAVMTALTRDGREISVTDAGYRARIRLLVLKKRLRMLLARCYHRIFK